MKPLLNQNGYFTQNRITQFLENRNKNRHKEMMTKLEEIQPYLSDFPLTVLESVLKYGKCSYKQAGFIIEGIEKYNDSL